MVSIARPLAIVATAVSWMGVGLLSLSMSTAVHSQVDPSRIRYDIEMLSADNMAGRARGSVGARRAAAYIVDRLREIQDMEPGSTGVDPWLQGIRVTRSNLTRADCANVLGNLLAADGVDCSTSKPAIIVAAHYDHLGERWKSLESAAQIYNGADDNASGCAVVLEVARQLSASRPAGCASFLFHFYSAEESGLEGSEQYIEEPTWPLERTSLMINVDMAGRLTGNTLFVAGVGTSPMLSELVTEAAKKVGIAVVTRESGITGSDNLAFLEAAVPAIHISTGRHDDYHKPTDRSDRINVEGAARIASFVYALAILADEAHMLLSYRPVGSFVDAEDAWRPSIWTGLGVAEPLDGSTCGFMIESVEADSPGDRAGIAVGDRVIAVNGISCVSVDGFEAVTNFASMSLEAQFEYRPTGITIAVQRYATKCADEAESVSLMLELIPEVR